MLDLSDIPSVPGGYGVANESHYHAVPERAEHQ